MLLTPGQAGGVVARGGSCLTPREQISTATRVELPIVDSFSGDLTEERQRLHAVRCEQAKQINGRRALTRSLYGDLMARMVDDLSVEEIAAQLPAARDALGPSRMADDFARLFVCQLSTYAIDWLNEETGGGYRLPSEAEWEYAVRAGSVSRYHFGDDESELCRYGNVGDTTKLPNGYVWTNKANCSDGAVYPVAVGSYRPNPFGLYDMHGNVDEWVADCWHDNYEGAPSEGRAWTTNCDGSRRAVVRGGAWVDYPGFLRSAFRDKLRPSYRFVFNGFRLVQDLNP